MDTLSPNMNYEKKSAEKYRKKWSKETEKLRTNALQIYSVLNENECRYNENKEGKRLSALN